MEWEGLQPQLWRMRQVAGVTVVIKRYFEPHPFALVESKELCSWLLEGISVRVCCKFIILSELDPGSDS